MMRTEMSYRCPVCRAPFRSARECSRCGADLSRVMRVLAEAQICRREAVAAAYAGDFQKARDLAVKAQGLHRSETGRRLLLLTSWLALRLGKPAHGLAFRLAARGMRKLKERRIRKKGGKGS